MAETEYLNVQDIKDDVVVIKINKLYRPEMNSEELYETVRGIWKRRIDSVSDADYCLAVYKGLVVEVYKIDNWFPAGTLTYKTRILKSERCIGRIEFEGKVAVDNVRNRYIGKSVKNLYKNGEANPVKLFHSYR